MAPPAGPRPGWSRRAQYGLFFSFIAAIAGLVIGLGLLGLSVASPKRFDGVRGVALDATAPATAAMRQVTATVAGLASGADLPAGTAKAKKSAAARSMVSTICRCAAVNRASL